jgi:hypothetical protein
MGKKRKNSNPAAGAIVPGVYWVTYPKEHRDWVDNLESSRLHPVKWRAFIAEWGISSYGSPDEYVWMLIDSELGAEVDDFVIIAGPLEAPYVHP